jgi:hypothetical protein
MNQRTLCLVGDFESPASGLGTAKPGHRQAVDRSNLTENSPVLGPQALREEISGLEVQRESAKEQLALIREEHAVTRGLLEQGLAQKPKVLALERADADLVGSRGRLTADIAKARQNILAAEARITSLKKGWLEKLIAQLREVQSRIADLSERISASGDIAARTEVRAPVTGIVIRLHIHTFWRRDPPGRASSRAVAGRRRSLPRSRCRTSVLGFGDQCSAVELYGLYETGTG